MHNRQYSKEFKIQACELVLKDGLKVMAVAEKLSIHRVMLHRWIEEYETYGKEEAFVGTGHLRPKEAEYKKLLRENERLKVENEILKKAAAYFAKHPAEE